MLSLFGKTENEVQDGKNGPERIDIQRPFDLHLHLRQGEMLKDVLPYTTAWCAGALIMPNTKPPILSGQDANRYLNEIENALTAIPNTRHFTPLMTIQIVPTTTPEDISRARYDADVTAGKVYPKGMTTNAENGVEDYEALYPVFAQMEANNMVLSLHGEHPGATIFCLDREKAFLDILGNIVARFPKLKIVLEHVTTAEAVEAVAAMPNTVAATITVHHLVLTLDNVIGHMLKPHYFCKPVAKRPKDRDAVLQAALSGNPKFFLGTDSAPHLKGAKECADGCAGIFSAPVAPAVIATIFGRNNALDRVNAFTSVFGPNHYGIPPSKRTLTLIREPWVVPIEIYGIVPFLAGAHLPWRAVI